MFFCLLLHLRYTIAFQHIHSLQQVQRTMFNIHQSSKTLQLHNILQGPHSQEIDLLTAHLQQFYVFLGLCTSDSEQQWHEYIIHCT